MKVLSDEEDEKFRQRVREEIGFHHEPSEGWEPLNMENAFSIPWPGNDEYPEYEEKVIQTIKEQTEEVYILAFETDQYVPSAKQKFQDKYNGNTIKASPDEIEEVSRDLIVIYILPEDLNWTVLFDHDGNFHFAGEIKDRAMRKFEENSD